MIRKFTSSDVKKIRQFVYDCGDLTLHSTYTYWVLANYIGNSFLYVDEGDNILGYMSGLRSDVNPDVYFFWQVGIAKNKRNTGIANSLFDKLYDVAVKEKCKSIQFTITDDNVAINNFLAKYFGSKGLELTRLETVKIVDGLSNTDESEVLYEVRI